MPASAVAYTAPTAAARPVGAAATSAAPATSETKNAHWWKTPRRRGFGSSAIATDGTRVIRPRMPSGTKKGAARPKPDRPRTTEPRRLLAQEDEPVRLDERVRRGRDLRAGHLDGDRVLHAGGRVVVHPDDLRRLHGRRVEVDGVLGTAVELDDRPAHVRALGGDHRRAPGNREGGLRELHVRPLRVAGMDAPAERSGERGRGPCAAELHGGGVVVVHRRDPGLRAGDPVAPARRALRRGPARGGP